jgi:radical SAM protein with 4Fe4S-binding SPASM domain
MKPTNYCNVDCEHCYLPLETRQNRLKMSEDTIRQSATLALKLAQNEGHKAVHFIWHGGEPLMLQPDFYYRAGEIIEEEIGKGYFTESIQTSMIPYTSKWAPLIKDRYAGNIGTSVDFTQRKIKSSSDNYVDFFLKRVAMARADGLYITPGMVPTRHELGKGSDIVQWAVNNDFVELNVERYSNVGSTNTVDRPTNRQHSEFLIELFDEVLEKLQRNENAPYINVVSACIVGLLYNLPSDRWGTKCQREFVVIEPNGDLNSCPDRAMHEKAFSNASAGAKAFQESKDRRKWIRVMDITHKKPHCFNCEHASWCKSGCPVTPNGPAEGETECSGFKTYVDYVSRAMEIGNNKALLEEYALPPGEQVVPDFDIRDIK